MNHQNRFAKRSSGFNLVELMIVVVIIGILAAIAYPGYVEWVQRSKRVDAQDSLVDAASRQVQYLMDRKTYTSDMTDLGYAADPAPSIDREYLISAAACAGGTIATCYVLTATPNGSQSNDLRCLNLTLTSAGVKSASGSSPDPVGECW